MDAWKVLPHGPLEAVVPRLWALRGSLSNMPLPRYMVIYHLGDDRLLIHSAVCVDEATMSRIGGLGTPAYLLVPNGGHRLDAPAWKARFPNIRTLCPRNARAKVEEVIRVDGLCEDELPPLGITCHVPPGFQEGYELIYDVEVGGGRALVINDVLANAQKVPGFQGMLLGLLGTPGGGFGRARIVNFRFGKNRRAFAPFLAQLAARTDLVALTVSHGLPVVGEENVRAALALAAAKVA